MLRSLQSQRRLQEDCRWLQVGSYLLGDRLGDQFGSALDMSDNGNTIVVGTGRFDVEGPLANENSGVVRVFQFSVQNETDQQPWEQRGDDIRGQQAGEFFGFSVSISGDGSTIAAGAVSYRGLTEFGATLSANVVALGTVRLYQYVTSPSPGWRQIGSSIDGKNANESNGHAVSLSNDGQIVAIGAAEAGLNGPMAGVVRIYKLVNGEWLQLGSDIAGLAEGGLFGAALDLSADGDVLVVGAPGATRNGLPTAGQVRIYAFREGLQDWEQIGQTLGGEREREQAGYAVSISGSGTTVAVGSNDGNGDSRGHVWVYHHNLEDPLNDWTLVGRRIDGTKENSRFGQSLSLSNDGSSLVVGAPVSIKDDLALGRADVYQYSPVDQRWLRNGAGIYGQDSPENFGVAVAISADGKRFAGSSPWHDTNGINSGLVGIFENQQDNCLSLPPPSPGDSSGISPEAIAGVVVPMSAIFIALLVFLFRRNKRIDHIWINETAILRPENLEEGEKDDFFISHFGKDTKDRLALPLEYLLTQQGLTCFVDQRSIEVGEGLDQEIARGIFNCHIGVVLISENFLASKWCRRELRALYHRHIEENDNFKMITVFESEELLRLPVYKRLKKDATLVRKSGAGDRNHLVQVLIPHLMAQKYSKQIHDFDKPYQIREYNEHLDTYTRLPRTNVPATLKASTPDWRNDDIATNVAAEEYQATGNAGGEVDHEEHLPDELSASMTMKSHSSDDSSIEV